MKRLIRQYLQWGVAVAIATTATASFINPANAELIVTPEAVTLAGDRTRTLSTTLTFSNDEGNATLKTAVSDLRRADGAAFIHADQVLIEPVDVAVPEDAPAQMKITLDLADASANGEFTGALYLYHEAGRQVVPFTVRVKAAPIWPWILMFTGVGLGTWLSFYRDNGRPRDEIVVQVGELRNAMQAVAGSLDANYKVSIDAKLKRVFAALQDKNWTVAQAELKLAKERWRTWDVLEEDWLTQLRFGEHLVADKFEKLPDGKKRTLYMQQVREKINAIHRKLRTGEITSPQMLNNEFSEIRTQIVHYDEGMASVAQLQQRFDQSPLSEKDKSFWRGEFILFEERLNNLNPDDYDDWLSNLNQQKEKLNEAIAAAQKQKSDSEETSPDQSDAISGRSAEGQLPIAQGIRSAPDISSSEQKFPPGRSRWQLLLFNQTVRVVSIISLAWLGMIDLYSGKPTFGADPLRDYFALLAWGFGAEVTRESVVKATRDLGISTTK